MRTFVCIWTLLVISLSTQAQVACRCDGDSDGDGVMDCFDRCPDTGPGIAVTTHGCPWDTDGDGVADYKDYQLITPTECQPVDSMGIGKCPCRCVNDRPRGTICVPMTMTTWISFSNLSYRLDTNAIKAIQDFAIMMKANPNQYIQIIGFGSASYTTLQLGWCRMNEIRTFLIQEGIHSDRILASYGKNGPDRMAKIETPLLNVEDLFERLGRLPPPVLPSIIDERNKKVRRYISGN